MKAIAWRMVSFPHEAVWDAGQNDALASGPSRALAQRSWPLFRNHISCEHSLLTNLNVRAFDVIEPHQFTLTVGERMRA